jgi:RimJ/RimL family protein N-acetyltransferase
MLPVVNKDGEEKVYRINYAVHEILQDSNAAASTDPPTRSIGFVSLRSIPPDESASLPRLGFASTATTLSLEVAYMFLPTAWGRGYATESVNAMFDACKKADRGYWAPHKKLCVRAIVNNENIPSQRVMEKCGMGAPRVLEFKGDRFFLNGKWIEEHCLFIYEKMLVE